MMKSRKKREKRELIEKIMNNSDAPQTEESKKRETNKKSLWEKIITLDKRWWIFIGVIFTIIIIGSVIYYYNMFVTIRQEVRNARSDIETTLQQRENMVPAILTTITNFIIHENEIFIHAADERARSLENKPRSSESEPNPSGNPVPADDYNELLSKLFAIAENYPDIKTGEPFVLLMTKIADAEMEILNKRVEYNKKVLNFNIRVSSLPAVVLAYIFKIKQEPYFQWSGKPEWVTTLDEETRKRTNEILEKWRSELMDNK